MLTKKQKDTALISSTNLITKVSRELLIPALPLIAVLYHVKYSQAQHIVAAYFFGISLSRIIWTIVADRVSKTALIIALHILFIGASALCLYSRSFNLLLIARFLQAFAIAGVPLIARALIYYDYGTKETIKLYGYMSIISGWTPAITTSIAALLINHYGVDSLFTSLLVLGITNTFVLCYILHNRISQPRRQSNGPVSHVNSLWSSLRGIFRNKHFWLITLPFGLICAGNGVYMSIASFLLTKSSGLTVQAFGLSYFIIIAGESAGKLLSGKLIEKYSSQQLILFAIIMALLSSILGLITLAFTHNPWILICIIAINYLGDGMITITSKEFICLLDKQNLSAILGFFTVSESLFSGIFSLIASYFKTSWQNLFLILISLAIASLCFRLCYPKTLLALNDD